MGEVIHLPTPAAARLAALAPWQHIPLQALNHGQLLQLFAAQPECDIRNYLWAPMQEDGFAYATNGHWIVRIPMADYDGTGGDITPKGDYPKGPLANVFSKAEAAAGPFAALQDIALPPQCEECGGNGISEGSTCPRCGGYGWTFDLSAPPVLYRGTWFSPVYLYLLSLLPGIEFAVSPPPAADPTHQSTASRFRLAGGIEGCLMPCKPPQPAGQAVH